MAEPRPARPGDLILGRHAPALTGVERDAARDALRRYAALLLRITETGRAPTQPDGPAGTACDGA